jgi:ActR/RegA family two-component response regulator
MTSNKILIVENEESGKVYKEILERALNVEVFWARNKDEAIHIVENNHIKVALLDQRLEAGELGTEVWKIIRDKQKDIKPIMLTGRAHRDEVGEAIKLGYVDYIDKLADLVKLPESVIKALESYNSTLLNSRIDRKFKLLFEFYKGINFLKKYKVYLISQILLDKDYVFEDKWIEKLSVEAGQTIEHEIEFEFEDRVEIEHQIQEELVSKYSLKVEVLKNAIEGGLTGTLKQEKRTKVIKSSGEKTKFKESLSLPAIPSDVDQDYLASKSFQINQVYERYQNIIEIVCPECKASEIRSIIFHIPTTKIAKRQIDVLKSGKRTTIDTGIVGK